MAITKSSGNVFADLGFDADEAAHLKVRADLMLTIRKLIAERNLTQVVAAEILGVSQPRVSDIVRGKLHAFTIDALIDMLAHLRGAAVATDFLDHAAESIAAGQCYLSVDAMAWARFPAESKISANAPTLNSGLSSAESHCALAA